LTIRRPEKECHSGRSTHALADSIMDKGLVLQPLTAFRSGDGYFLVVGERRLLAARLAGLSSVPVCVIPTIQRREDALSLTSYVPQVVTRDKNA
jgi:ParB family chromosome partitioning protein